MQTVLVTGGEGFTGRALADHLRKAGVHVVAGVRNRARKLALERENAKALVCDVTDAISVARAVASVKPDAIVHLGGISQPHAALADPLAGYQAIVSACANVLDAVRRSVPRCHVILASACDVYGNGGVGRQALSESASIAPVTTFGCLKANAESLARTFFANYHLNVTIARPFHYVGAGQSEHFFFASVARRLANWDAAVEGDALSLPDLSCTREILHVQDVVEAYAALLDKGRPNEVYNICGVAALTVREVVAQMVALSGRVVRIEEQPADPAGRIESLAGDGSKIKSETGWQPRRTTRDALSDLIGSFRTAPTPQAAL